MKKWAFIIGLLVCAGFAHGQVSNNPIVLVVTAPSGACTPGFPNQQVISTGHIWGCPSSTSTWTDLSAGSGNATTINGASVPAIPASQKLLISLPTSTTTEVCWDGDSTTIAGQGSPATIPASTFFAQMPVGAALTNNGANQNNYAVAGQTQAQILARYSASCHLNRPGTGSITAGYFIFWSTWNNSGSTAAQLFAGDMAEWAAAKADGYTVIAETSPLDTSANATVDQTRQQYNALLYQAKVNYVVNATNFSITSNVATVTAANAFVAGQVVTLGSIVPWTTATYFNNQQVTIISTGLSTTQFEFNFTHANVGSTADTGSASMKPFDYLLDLDSIAPNPTYVGISAWRASDARHPSSLFDSIWASRLSTMFLLGDDPGNQQVYQSYYNLYTGQGPMWSYTPGHIPQFNADTVTTNQFINLKPCLDTTLPSTGLHCVDGGTGAPIGGNCTASKGGFRYNRFDGPPYGYTCDATLVAWKADPYTTSCAMSAGTSCTATVATFTSTPLCTATPNGATAIASACNVSGTTATVTAGASNSATWTITVSGNPN